MTQLYSIKSIPSVPGSFRIGKFDRNLNLINHYVVNSLNCTCPQSHKPACKHRRMLMLFAEVGRIDTDYFLDHDTKTWHQPLTPDAMVEYHDRLKSPTAKAAPVASTPSAALATEGQAIVAASHTPETEQTSRLVAQPSVAPIQPASQGGLKRRKV